MNSKTRWTRSLALEILGETLLQSQEFERSFGYVVGLVFSGRPKIGLSELDDVQKEASRITLGQFIDRLRRTASVCEDIEDKLKTVLGWRNKMAHRIVDDPEYDLATEDGCHRLVVFLVKLQAAMVELTLVFTGLQATFLEDVGISTIPQLKLESSELFEIIDSLGYELFRADDAGG